MAFLTFMVSSQKAPSAIRCIKTCRMRAVFVYPFVRQKAPSTIRCIKTPEPRARRTTVLAVRKRLIPNEGGWRGWRVGLGVGVEVFT